MWARTVKQPVGFLLLYSLGCIGAVALVLYNHWSGLVLLGLYWGVVLAALWHPRWVAWLCVAAFELALLPLVLRYAPGLWAIAVFIIFSLIGHYGLIELIARLVEANRRHLTEAQEAQRRLHQILSRNPAVVYGLVPNPEPAAWRLTFLSDNAIAILGLDPATTPHTQATGLCGAVALRADWVADLERSGEASITYAYDHPDGRRLWLRDESRLVRDDRGGVLEVVGTVVDVTESRQMAAQLDEYEHQLSENIRQSPAILYRAFPDPSRPDGWDYVFHSANIVDVLGYDVHEITADPSLWLSRIHPEDQSRVVAAAKSLTAVGQLDPTPVMYEYRFQHRAGHWVWIQESQRVVVNAQGAPVALYGQSVDITARHHVEEALVESRREVEEIVHYSPAVLFHAVPDSEATDGLRYIYHTSNLHDVVGLVSSDVRTNTTPWLDRIHPDDRDDLIAQTRAYVLEPTRSEAPLVHTYRFLHGDGHQIWLQDTLRAVRDSEGRVLSVIGQNLDVTVQHQSAEALREAQARLSHFVRHSPLAMYAQSCPPDDPDHPITTYVSENVEELTGYTAHELLADQGLWHSRVRPEDQLRVREASTGSARRLYSTHYRFERRDGREIWLEDSWHAVRGADGRVVEYVGEIQDITARKQAEWQAAESQRFIAEMASAIPSHVIIADSVHQRIVYSNRSLDFLAPRDGDALADLPLLDRLSAIVHPEDLDVWNAFTARLPRLTDDETPGIQIRVRLSDEDWRDLRIRARVFARDELGAPSQFLAVWDDITAARQAERSLAESQHLLSRMTDALPQAVSIVDLRANDGRGAYVLANRSVPELLGNQQWADEGWTDPSQWMERIHPDDQDRWRTEAETLMTLGDGQVLEQRFRLPAGDGTWRHVRTRCLIFSREPSGAPRQILGVLDDLTQLHQAQADLALANEELGAALASAQRLAREAQAATQAKSEFLANMSHEIRTPLNAILGLAEILKEENLTADQHARVAIMMESGKTLLQIINDILDFSKIEAGRVALDTHDFDLAGVVEGTVDLLAERAQAKGIRLSCLVDPNLPVNLLGDSGRLRQVLLNLIGNAIKFTPQGWIHVRAEGSLVAEHTLEVRIDVQDTGIGIAPDAQARLFQPFEQAEASTTRRYGGTGLGLALVRRLVDLMGGIVTLNSWPGLGTTVTLALTFEVSSTAVAAQPVLARGRVLIVEPDAFEGEALDRYLSAAGWTCQTVSDVESALGLLKNGSTPDLLVADDSLDRPAIDSAHGLLSQLPLLGQLPRVIIGQPHGATNRDHHLARPVKRQALMEVVAAVVDGVRPIATPEPEHTITVSVARSRPLVLLAEDNPVNQTVARLQLDKLGFDVEVVGDGAAVVAAYQADPARYRLILMDCQMPILDGFEATRAIRQWEQSVSTGPITIIAMTANAMSGDRDECLAAGMDDYLSKPVSRKALEHALAFAG